VQRCPSISENVDGDEIHFVHRGRGTFQTEFGLLPYEEGDLIVVPKGITYWVVPDTSENFFVITETRGEVNLPDMGLIGQVAPY
jgi:homogentisate 1,2-dioxygenase